MREEKRFEEAIVAAFTERGEVTTVNRVTAFRRFQVLSGEWSEWLEGMSTYRHEGEPVNMLDEKTLEVVRTGQRLTLAVRSGTP